MSERKVSDRDLRRLRGLAAEGWETSDLAEEFGVSERHVRRLLNGERRPVIDGLDPDALMAGGASAAVEAWLEDVRLRGEDRVLSVMARLLAGKLDGCAASDTAGAAQAMPRLCSQLLATVERLAVGAPREPDRLDEINARRAARLAEGRWVANGRGGA